MKPYQIVLPFLFLAVALFCPAAQAQTTQPVADECSTSQLAFAPIRIAEQTQAPSGAIIARLSNGLRVVVKPHRTAPVLSVRAYVQAGGLYEGQWLGCGISHLVEHLVAKYCTTESGQGHLRTKSQDTVSRLDKIGGQANAYTSLDHTAYYISAVSSKADECIDLIVDQIARPEITPADFHREHGVVQRELEMGRDEPLRILYYLHQENLYQDHPAAVPVIGYPEPLSRLKRKDVLAYHGKMYVPQNVVLVIVGDVDPQAVLKRVVQGVQGFRQGRQPVFDLPAVPKLTGLRRIEKQSKAFQETAQMMSFQTIPLLDPDLYPLDVLSTIFSRGESSRLVRLLQFQKRLVTAVDTWSDTPAWGRGDFTISFRTRPAEADQAEAAILQELHRVIDEGVTEQELTRAKRQMTADYVRRQQTAESIAATLGRDLLTTGDLAFSENYTKNIQGVTRKQVRAAARKYFRFGDMAVTRVTPEIAQPETQPTTQSASAEREEVYTLSNGLRVVLCPSKDVGLAAMALASKGGLLIETPETNGLGNLVATLSTRGAAGRSGDEIASLFSDAGGSISGACGDNSLYWRASVLADDFVPAMGAFADVVLNPTFPQKELDACRPLIEAQIHRRKEHWFSQLEKFFREKFFVGSPWAMLPEGRLEVVAKAAPEQLKAFHDRVVLAGSSVLAIYGNFDPAVARELIARRFEAMPTGPTPPHPTAGRVVNQGGETYVLPTHTKQAGVIVAAAGTAVPDLERRLPLMLLDTILSGYSLPSGWLHEELRGKKLVYVVHAYHKTGFSPGAFIVYAGAQPENAKQVVEIIRKNLRKAAEYTPTREELDRAISSIITSEILDNQTADALALNAAINELYGLGVDWPRTLEAKLKAVTPQQVQAEAKRLIDTGLVVTVITPQPECFSDETIEKAEEQMEEVK
ncbi:MAG: insulinase family protein [Phycisphaerae bacterium]|nr:insulinase family protein [Phycisphaerae bacterium]